MAAYRYQDYAGMNREKESFWRAVEQDGRLDAIKAIAANDYIFAVNEAVNHKRMGKCGFRLLKNKTRSEEE